MCSMHCSETKPHLAPITDSQHKIVTEYTKSSVKFTMCLKFFFTDRQRRNKHNFWDCLVLRIRKEISILLSKHVGPPIMRPGAVYSIIFFIVSKRERKFPRNFHYFGVVFSMLMSGNLLGFMIWLVLKIEQSCQELCGD